MPPFLLVNVDLGADHDRHARKDRGEAAVQARGEQKRVHDVGVTITQIARLIASTSNGRRSPGSAPEHVNGTPVLRISSPIGPASWMQQTIGSKRVRQVAHQVQHHLLGAADHERMRQINDTNGRGPLTRRRAPGSDATVRSSPSRSEMAAATRARARSSRCRRRSHRSRSARPVTATARARRARAPAISTISSAIRTCGCRWPLPTL